MTHSFTWTPKAVAVWARAEAEAMAFDAIPRPVTAHVPWQRAILSRSRQWGKTAYNATEEDAR